MRKFLFLILSAASFAGAAQAGDLQLSGNKHWLLLASDKDVDVAIGIARRQYGFENETRVVSSRSGYYGVIAGPYAANSISDLKKADKQSRFDELPKDALLSQGANYLAIAWEPAPSGTNASVPYTFDKVAEFSSGALNVKIKGEKLDADRAFTSVEGKDGQGSFHFDLGKDVSANNQMTVEAMSSDAFNNATVVKLLAKADGPQVIVTNYTGGAHCCVETTILAREPGAAAWAAIKGATLDGGGYWFEDVDGDGGQELLSVDNSFLYAFDSYAGSNAPIRIARLNGGKIEDVTEDPAMHARLLQDLAGMEFSAKVQPDLWKANGFLAGWLASKIRLGQGDAAWAKFMANYDKHSDFGPQTCETGQSIADCPAEKLKTIPVPKAMAQFLKDNGYTPLPKAAERELN